MNMLNIKLMLSASLFALLLVGQPHAEESAEPDPTEAVRSILKSVLPSLEPDSITATPVAGIFEVAIGTDIVYVSRDGKYLLQGKLIDLERRQNLTDERLAAVRAAEDARLAPSRLKSMSELGEENMLIYGPESAAHTVTVFTDIDCGYCRKLHTEIDQLNEAGIRIRYLLFPRSGANTESYFKAVSAWCADDPHTALTEAKRGKNIPRVDCENPVNKHLALGKEFGLRGTPALVLEDGKMIPGYMPWKKLSQMLEQRKSEIARQ